MMGGGRGSTSATGNKVRSTMPLTSDDTPHSRLFIRIFEIIRPYHVVANYGKYFFALCFYVLRETKALSSTISRFFRQFQTNMAELLYLRQFSFSLYDR